MPTAEYAQKLLHQAAHCPQCGLQMLCACPACLLDERQVPYGYTYFHWETEKGVVEETGEEIEVQFCECNNCGYSFMPDEDDDPWVIERDKKEWPDEIG